MRVLFVSRWLWEERRRGGDTPGFFEELLHELARQGVDLTFLSQAADAGLIPESRPLDGINAFAFSRDKRSGWLSLFDKIVKPWAGYRKAVTDAAVIRRFVRQHGPFDAVIAQCEEPDGLACALARVAGRMPPLITQVHDLRYEFSAKGIRFTRKSSLGFAFRMSARVVANSKQTAVWLTREYGVPQEKIGQCRIHLTAPFLRLAANVSSVRAGSQRILFLGALNRKKAPDIFLRAAILLAPLFPQLTFVIVGPETAQDHPFRALLQELALHPLLAGRLEWLGWLDTPAVIEQIGKSKVVVCPSLLEAFSRTTIEALALCRPVVVTDTTGAANWVRETGCGSVVASADPKALADAIRTWAAQDKVPDASASMISQLNVARAAEDLIREVCATLNLQS